MGIGILLNTISYRFRENMRQLHKIIRSRWSKKFTGFKFKFFFLYPANWNVLPWFGV